MEPTGLPFEAKGVLNPAAVKADGWVHLFYRALGNDNRSSIGYCRLKGTEVVERMAEPLLVPELDYEKMGMEDPRITIFEGTYYMLYTAYDGFNARIAYATSTNLKKWKKGGVLSPGISYDKAEDIYRFSGDLDERYRFYERMYRGVWGDEIILWEKDAVLFPVRINGMLAMLHRVLPGIQICYFENFSQLNDSYWKAYLKHLKDCVVLEPQYSYEKAFIGSGCPPIATEKGWILIYHAVQLDGVRGRVYRVGAALLDLKNPEKVLGRTPVPLFEPKFDYETRGNVDNVVFPTGAVVDEDQIYIYYGCADKNIGVKWVGVDELLSSIR